MSDKHERILATGRASDGLPVDLDECGLCHEEWPCRASLQAEIERLKTEVADVRGALGASTSEAQRLRDELLDSGSIRDNVYRREAMEHLKTAGEATSLLRELREWSRSEYQNNPRIDAKVDAFLRAHAAAGKSVAPQTTSFRPTWQIVFVDEKGHGHPGQTNVPFVVQSKTTIVRVEVEGHEYPVEILPVTLGPGESITIPFEVTST